MTSIQINLELQRQLGLISHSDEMKQKVINYIKSLVRNPREGSAALDEPVPDIVKSLIGAGEKVAEDDLNARETFHQHEMEKYQ